ncbi:MAG: YciK family oxidoreductase [Gammaproteobacteria bacterium]|nr:YciK family oxidoreductase [Gammaproteobacteria bacterium]MCF6230108.1 YciK family oxidoreductase [Gammaproteobacteria bacterium]
MQTIPQAYRAEAGCLAERVILVTGATSGIGATAAETFANHGATIILLGRKQRALEQIYDRIEASGAPKPAIIPCNLETATRQDFQTLAGKIEQEFGQLDGILHNAATLGSLTPIEHYSAVEWNKVMQVNLTAPVFLTQACLNILKKSPDASILFTSDSVGRKARAYWGGYSISKFGIESLTQILADELEENTNIRVNNIDPGALLTRFRKNAYPGESNEALRQPTEIMDDYLYLIGPDSKGVNGVAFTARS